MISRSQGVFGTTDASLPEMPNTPGLGRQPANAPQDPSAREDAARPAAALPAGIVFQGPAFGPVDQASEASAQLLALARVGVPVCLVPTDSPDDSGSLLGSATRQQL